MEQYEVADAMGRTKGAYLVSRLRCKVGESLDKRMKRVSIEALLMSGNFVASKYGAFRLSFPDILNYDQQRMHYLLTLA
jgi:hypothetical protein